VVSICHSVDYLSPGIGPADRVMESLNGTKPAVMCNVTHRENDAISEIVRAKPKELGSLAD
jgi:hypothetical protein